MDIRNNPWKWSLIALAVGVPLAVLAYAGGERMLREPATETRAASQEVERPRAASRPVARPAPALIEDCNQYAAAVRDNRRIAKDGAIGAVVGAGVGAAGGAIADGGDGAGKGAGIGAVVGVVSGALYGLNEENERSERARQAYSDCLARRG